MEKTHLVLGSTVNASIVTTTQGVIVIDTAGTGDAGREVFEAASARGEVLFVINTHEHGDHLAGNHLFSCRKVSSHEAREQMLKAGNAEQGRLPDLTFNRTLTLYVGEQVQVTHFGGHCPGALVVYLPERKLLFVGDLVFSGRVPYMGDADFARWIQALEELEAWEVTTVVPGHGAVGGKEILRAQREWLTCFVRDVRAWHSRGLSPDSIVAELLERESVPERWHRMLSRAIELALAE